MVLLEDNGISVNYGKFSECWEYDTLNFVKNWFSIYNNFKFYLVFFFGNDRFYWDLLKIRV